MVYVDIYVYVELKMLHPWRRRPLYTVMTRLYGGGSMLPWFLLLTVTHRSCHLQPYRKPHSKPHTGRKWNLHRFCLGSRGYLLSMSVATRILDLATRTRFFWLEDVYVTGILRTLLRNVTVVNLAKRPKITRPTPRPFMYQRLWARLKRRYLSFDKVTSLF